MLEKINKETLDYIKEHESADPAELALHDFSNGKLDKFFALQQIEGRQKAQEKLPVFAATEDLIYPPKIALEQCSSEAAANYKASLVSGTSFYDLTGGFGIDSIAFSKHFETGCYVERSPLLCNIMEHNCKQLNISNLSCNNDEASHFLENADVADLIYLDPSRRNKAGNKVVAFNDSQPDVLQLKPLLYSKTGKWLLLKLSPMLDIKAAVRLFPETESVHVVAVNGECKELLLLISPHSTQTAPCHYVAVDIRHDVPHCFCFTEEEEQKANIAIGTPCGNYLYEPNTAILKAGAFKRIAEVYALTKLHPHSHLYTASEAIPDFPGRSFVILDWSPVKKETYKELAAYKKANITVRNFPMSPEELRKKIKIEDGGNTFLFATTTLNNTKIIMVCEKLSL